LPAWPEGLTWLDVLDFSCFSSPSYTVP